MQKNKPRYDYIFILPIKDEAVILEKSVSLLHNYLSTEWANSGKDWLIIIADNGSSDGSGEIASSLRSKFSGKVIHDEISEAGRGRALRKIAREYVSSHYMYLDIDLPIEFTDIPKLLAPIESDKADLVVGSRSIQDRPLPRKIMTLGLRWLNRLMFNLWVSDSQCGAKAFNYSAAQVLAKDINLNSYYLDTEFLVAAKTKGLKIDQAKVNWIETRFPERGSKIARPVKESLECGRSLIKIWGWHFFLKSVISWLQVIIAVVLLVIALLFLVNLA